MKRTLLVVIHGKEQGFLNHKMLDFHFHFQSYASLFNKYEFKIYLKISDKLYNIKNFHKQISLRILPNMIKLAVVVFFFSFFFKMYWKTRKPISIVLRKKKKKKRNRMNRWQPIKLVLSDIGVTMTNLPNIP